MAFSSFAGNLARGTVGNDQAPTIWTYSSTDSSVTITTSGYFNAAANRLKVGDFVFFSNTVSPFIAGVALVKSNTRSVIPTFVAGVVDLFDATAINSSVSLNSA
jgi:hypothetical protein